MKQSEKIEMFLNWLMDNNYFNVYINQFSNKFEINEFIYTILLKKLKTINYQDFVTEILDKPIGKNSFELELIYLSWNQYYKEHFQCDKLKFENGDYIRYSVINFGLKTDYVSIVECFDDGFVSEYCSAVINSEYENMINETQYYDSFKIDENFVLCRKANENEIKWLNKHIKEYDNMIFDKDKKAFINI